MTLKEKKDLLNKLKSRLASKTQVKMSKRTHSKDSEDIEKLKEAIEFLKEDINKST